MPVGTSKTSVYDLVQQQGGCSNRYYHLTGAETEEWKKRFLSGAENTLRSKPLDE